MKIQVDQVLDEESIKKLKEEFPFIFEPEQKQKKNETDGSDPPEAFPKRAKPKTKYIDGDLAAVEIDGLWYTDPRIRFCEMECDYNNTTECPQNLVSCVRFFLKLREIGSRDVTANIPEDIFEDFTEDVTDEDLDLDNFVKDKWPGKWKKIFNGCLKKFNFDSYVQQMSDISKYNAKQKETLFAEIAKASRTAVKLAMKYRHMCSLEDMIQEAKTEICEALSGYKLEDGKFTSYSFKFIQGAIFGEISCNHDIFSFNSTSGKICKIIRKVRRAFYIEKGKYPTEEETVDKVWEIYLKEIAERDKIGKARGKKKKNGEEDDEAPKPPSKKTIRQLYHLTFKIDQSTQIDQQNEESNALPIEDPDNNIEKLFDAEELVFTNKRRRWILGIWPDDKDKIALELYQTRNYTYEEIGKHLGVTREWARQIYKRALKRMERALEMSKIPYRQWMLALERLNITRAVAK
jgi:RNA polymerase sigma factor (sigma-70 family)